MKMYSEEKRKLIRQEVTDRIARLDSDFFYTGYNEPLQAIRDFRTGERSVAAAITAMVQQAEQKAPGILKRYGIDDINEYAQETATEIMQKAETCWYNILHNVDHQLREIIDSTNSILQQYHTLAKKEDPTYGFSTHHKGYELTKVRNDEYTLQKVMPDQTKEWFSSIISAKDIMRILQQEQKKLTDRFPQLAPKTPLQQQATARQNKKSLSL